ncbi:MAG: cytochrome c biogenesis protein ResB, partial [Hydromonas sp.]|nr:cytochrome c biogenesis protein ResB [Hydromonas sp.]
MINGAAFFVSMQRNDLQNNFTNWHIPADADASIGDYMRIQKGIHDEAIVLQALNRLASARSLKPNERADYIKNAAAIMQLFREGGLIAISDKLSELPEIEQERMWQSVTGLIHVMTNHILNLQREQAQLAPRVDNEQTQRFIDDSINSYTKGTQYPAPFYLELESFTEIKSSELQVTRSPGQWWVYLGSLMLVLGTLAMAFIRERRVWLHITPDTTGNTLTLAMSSTRRTYDYRAHWQTLQARLQAITSENP